MAKKINKQAEGKQHPKVELLLFENKSVSSSIFFFIILSACGYWDKNNKAIFLKMSKTQVYEWEKTEKK